jgi:hypothetical protein
MDEPRFDAWTRRRVHRVAAGFLSAALTVIGVGESAAQKRRRKRCRKLGKTCKPGSKKKRCCGDLRCDVLDIDPSAQTRCCKRVEQPCADNLDCCGGLCCGPSGVCEEICFSDRALKANFGSVDPADMLARVRDLPISTWNYTSDAPAIRHIGPMAQDFRALFGVGADDRRIHPIDGQGAALAAIQGLANQLDTLRDEHARLMARIAALEAAPDACIVESH